MTKAKLTIFFDGEYPIFKKEINFLQSINQEGNLKFIDINNSDLAFGGKYRMTCKDAMERIHPIKSNGSVIKDLKVFHEAYSLIELGWIYMPKKLPIIDKISQFIYKPLVKYRLKITLRPSIEKEFKK